MWGLLPVGALQQIDEPNQIALHVEVRIFQRIANPGLRSQVNYGAEVVAGEHVLDAAKVRDVALDKLKSVGLFEDLQAGILEALVVELIEIVDPQDFSTRGKESPANVKTHEACASRDQYS